MNPLHIMIMIIIVIINIAEKFANYDPPVIPLMGDRKTYKESRIFCFPAYVQYKLGT